MIYVLVVQEKNTANAVNQLLKELQKLLLQKLVCGLATLLM